ncbi:MAG: hypothetical protein HETSPECPRED_003577 [Heterodermia speciosa]|uniref:Uncharacterized protein n=1 Tax=Heterodermia speciosa TaxID=116794 RepID=A0A8H3F1V9_9LECA|nr:MAG: hypothetical protein HETSPECPRED_003577 [Heterodermia speciosa]
MGFPPWDYDLYPEEKFEAREHFMLMPEQRRQIQAKRALQEKRKERAWLLYFLTDNLEEISSLLPQLPQRPSSKTGNGTLERLNNDCLMYIMQHSRLDSGLWNLLEVSERCRVIWEEAERSILRGMQEQRFPDFIAMFGKVGCQSGAQLHNLASALATDAWKLRAEVWEPQRCFLDMRKDDERLYEKSLILYLESTNDYFNDRVQLLHKLGSFEPCSRHVTKSAVLALWRIGWSRRGDREWVPGGSLESSFTVGFVQDILNQQPEAVRLRVREILHILASKIDQTSRISSDMKPWVEDREKCVRQGMTLSLYNVSQWHEEAINATIVMEVVLRGIGGAIDYVADIDSGEDAADETDQVQCPRLLQSICASRKTYDETGLEDRDLCNLGNHVKVAQALGVDVFASS